jgi:Ca2+-binding RTX toxin-like protein
MLFIGGSHDVAILTGGTEQVRAYRGYNVITTGAGDDTIRISGAGNHVDGGSGTNTIIDAGSGNTIVMPDAGAGVDQIYGGTMTNGDEFDFTSALKGTDRNGSRATVDQFLHCAPSGTDTIISISPVANGIATIVANFHDAGAMDMNMLLAHSIL